MLAAFELLQEKSPEPPNAETPLAHKIVPKDVAPELKKKTIEVSRIYLVKSGQL